MEEIEGYEDAPWGADNAEIIINNKPYEDFKESYLEGKSQSELEDIFTLGYGGYPTFKLDDELEAYIIEGTEYSTFDQALQAITSDETMNEEKFVQMLQETALRNERNFLKILVVEKMTT